MPAARALSFVVVGLALGLVLSAPADVVSKEVEVQDASEAPEAVATVQTKASASCTITVGDKTYDLSPLSGGATFQTGGDFPEQYSVSPCGDASKPDSSCPSGCNGYQLDGAHKCWCLGKLNQATFTVLSNGVQIDYAGGSARTNPSGVAALELKLICAETEVKPSEDSEDPVYHYQVEWKTPAICAPVKPGGGGGSGGGLSGVAIFDIVVVVSFVAFIMFGSLYRFKVKGESGSNVIPLRDFWKETPFLVKDGCVFTFGVIKTTFYKITGKAESI